jgi:hypothetical protein
MLLCLQSGCWPRSRSQSSVRWQNTLVEFWPCWRVTTVLALPNRESWSRSRTAVPKLGVTSRSRTAILTKHNQNDQLYDQNDQIHVKQIQERHFLRKKKTLRAAPQPRKGLVINSKPSNYITSYKLDSESRIISKVVSWIANHERDWKLVNSLFASSGTISSVRWRWGRQKFNSILLTCIGVLSHRCICFQKR